MPRLHLPWIILTASLVLLLEACASSCGGGTESVDLGVNEAFVQDFARARCELNLRCLAESHTYFVFEPETCAALWLEHLDETWLDSAEAAIASVRAGRIRIDPEPAKACLQEIRAAQCANPYFFSLEDFPSCRAAFEGRLGLGERCIASTACSGDLVCRASEGKGCEGTCLPLGEGGCWDDRLCARGQRCVVPYGKSSGRCVAGGNEGAPCSEERPCRLDLRCREAGSGSECVERAGAGEPCGDPSDCIDGLVCREGACRTLPAAGEKCGGNWSCAAGLTCVDQSSPATCHALPQSGEPCLNFRCADGLQCARSNDSWTCLPYVPEGQPCETTSWGKDPCIEGTYCSGTCRPTEALGEACEPGGCLPGLVCWNGRCEPAPSAGDGCFSHCRTCEGPSYNRCELGAWCDGNGTCRAFAEEGEICKWLQCRPGLACLWNPIAGLSTCVRRARLGEPCGRVDREYSEPQDRQCEAGLACVVSETGATCHQAPGVGETCGFEESCAAGTMCVRPPADARCQPLPGLGESCTNECAPGLVCDHFDLRGRGVCRRPPAEGEGCRVQWGAGERCAEDGVHCIPLSLGHGRCLHHKRLGEACSERLECGGLLSQSICDVEGSGRCIERPGPGEPCVLFDGVGLCDPVSAYCDLSGGSAVCRPFKALGEPCTAHRECGAWSGRCGDPFNEGPMVCTKWPSDICEP